MLTSISISSCKAAKALNSGQYRHTSWAKFRRIWLENNCPLVSIFDITLSNGKKCYFCTLYVGDFLWFSPFGTWKTACQFDLPF